MSDYVKLHRVHQVPLLNGCSYKATAVWASIHLVIDRRGRMELAGVSHQDVLVRRLAIDTKERQWFYAGLRELEQRGLVVLEDDVMVLVGHAGAQDAEDGAGKRPKTPRGSVRITDVSQTSDGPSVDLSSTFERGIADVSQTFGDPSADLRSVSGGNHSRPLARARSREESRREEKREEESVERDVVAPLAPEVEETPEPDVDAVDPPPQPYVETQPLRSIEGGKADSGAVAGAGSDLTPHQLATAHGLIVAAFRRRWEGHRALIWIGVQGHPAHTAARWLAAQAERDRRPAADIVEEVADAWFADGYVRERKWPWRLFAKQFSEFYGRAKGGGVDEPREYTNDLSGLDRFTKGTTP